MVDKMEPSSATRKLSEKPAIIQPQRSRTDTKKNIRSALRQAAGAGSETIMPKVCDPQGEPEARLHEILARIEPGLAAMAATEEGWEFFVIITDKSRQNPINKLGGYDAAGDASIEAYWEAVGQAASMMAGLFDNPMQLEFLRISSSSDEGVLVIAGRNISKELNNKFGEKATMSDIFNEAWAIAREDLDLSGKTYQIVMPAANEVVDLDLQAFSQVLRHPYMVVSSTFSVSDPIAIKPNGSGFIGDAIRKLENDEVPFYNDLPLAFMIHGIGRPEVLTPFNDNLLLMAARDPSLIRMGSGCFVEIKLAANEKDAMALLKFIEDWNGFKGTRKGFAEIIFRRFGMRGLNTYEGKGRTNSILTPIAQAMGRDIGQQHAVIPVTGGYLLYWLNLPPTPQTARLVKEAIRRRIHSEVQGDPGYIRLGLEPDVIIMDAASVDLADVRAKFILQSLGRADSPAWLLDATDFVPNFVENVRRDVQRDIRNELGISGADARNLDIIESICAQNRTVRDTEDTVAIARRDNANIEDWLFDFAKRTYHQMFQLLTERAVRERR